MKKFEDAEMEIIHLEEEDVIVSSGCTDNKCPMNGCSDVTCNDVTCNSQFDPT